MIRVWLFRPLLAISAIALLLVGGANNASGHAPKSLLGKAIAESCIDQDWSQANPSDCAGPLADNFTVQTELFAAKPVLFSGLQYTSFTTQKPHIRAPPTHA